MSSQTETAKPASNKGSIQKRMKLKTSKTASKRIQTITGTGKAMRLKMSAQHLAPGKSRRTKKSTKFLLEVHPADTKRLKKLLPYAKIK